MPKVIIDFLFNQEDIILKYPLPFIVILMIGFIIGWGIQSLLQKDKLENNKEKLEANEERLKYKEDKIKEKDSIIQGLEQRLASQGEISQNTNTHDLSRDEIEALKAIKQFQNKHPFQSPEPPSEYSVDNLAADLKMTWIEANEILSKLRRIGFFKSIWDNYSMWADSTRLINEARPGRLSKDGEEFLRKDN